MTEHTTTSGLNEEEIKRENKEFLNKNFIYYITILFCCGSIILQVRYAQVVK